MEKNKYIQTRIVDQTELIEYINEHTNISIIFKKNFLLIN